MYLYTQIGQKEATLLLLPDFDFYGLISFLYMQLVTPMVVAKAVNTVMTN